MQRVCPTAALAMHARNLIYQHGAHLVVDTCSPVGKLPASIRGPPPKANSDGSAPVLAELPSDCDPESGPRPRKLCIRIADTRWDIYRPSRKCTGHYWPQESTVLPAQGALVR